MLYLGIDWGEKRIGLALGDNETGIASPFRVVKNLKEVLEVIRGEGVEAVVVGRPVSISNHQLAISNREFNAFADGLKEKTDRPVFFMDERLSSKAADALAGDRKTKASRDAAAAMIILQAFFDRN